MGRHARIYIASFKPAKGRLQELAFIEVFSDPILKVDRVKAIFVWEKEFEEKKIHIDI